MEFRTGQVVVSEVDASSWMSRSIGKLTGSRVSHAVLVLDGSTAIEAAFPRVRVIDLKKRLRAYEQERRAWAALEYPGLSREDAAAVARHARSYEGRFYDVGQVAVFAALGRFFMDGSGTLVCSRLITAAFEEGAMLDLFPSELLKARYPACHPRLDNLSKGFAAPVDLLHSMLEPLGFASSATCPTYGHLAARREDKC